MIELHRDHPLLGRGVRRQDIRRPANVPDQRIHRIVGLDERLGQLRRLPEGGLTQVEHVQHGVGVRVPAGAPRH